MTRERMRQIAMEEFFAGNDTVPLYDWCYYVQAWRRIMGVM